MSGAEDDCRPVREALVDLVVEGRPVSDLPPPSAAHLRSCEACERFERGLEPAPSLFGAEPLYTEALRRRTLAAVAAAGDNGVPSLLPLLVPAAAVSLAASLVGPIWLGTRLVEPLVASRWLALGIAVAVSTSFGLAAAGTALVAMLELRGARQALGASWRRTEGRTS
jgi:hypothetical protein